MRYIIDSFDNGYVLTIKTSSQGSFVAKEVYPNIGDLYESIDDYEIKDGKMIDTNRSG